MYVFVSSKPVPSPFHGPQGQLNLPPPPRSLLGCEGVSEQTCADVILRRRGSSSFCLFSTLSQVYFPPRNEVSHLRWCLLPKRLTPWNGDQRWALFVVESPSSIFYRSLGAKKREGHSIHIFTLAPDICPSVVISSAPNSSERGRPKIHSVMSPEATTQLSLSRECVSPLSFNRSARGDSLVVLWLSELPSASLTPPLTGVNWLTNPAIRLAHAPPSFLSDFLVYCPLPGC